ncbi:AMP-binding protein, partial [Phaeobacter sp. HF9A]|uniref:AMP-binding protein n=1 Tax=Phaeobacter sp. HF9A TaxID=2721561 RepID=UPI00142FBA4C
VPVEPETPRARLLQVAQACGAEAVLIAADAETLDAATRADLAALDLPLLSVDVDARPEGEVCAAPRAPQDVAYVMFSSGTLGQPKGIQVTYANLLHFVDWLPELLPDVGPAVTGTIRHCFDVSLFEIWSAWARLIPITALDHADFADSTGYIRRLGADRVGTWVSTPSIMRMMLKNRRFTGAALPDMACFVFCGEALPKPLVAELFARFPGARVINTYGPTECTVAVTSVEITAAHLASPEALPIGYARPGVQLAALSSRGGARGEIEISGRSVGPGYIGLPEKQAKAFPRPEHYLSGDLGQVDAQGLWYFHGRMDREVKVQGMRIDLNEIEAHIRRQPGIEDVIVEPYVLRGEPRALNAYVIGAESEAELEALARDLAVELPSYLVPRFWYAGFDAGLNANCKLDRSRLAGAAAAARCRFVHVPPRVAQPA